MNREILQQALHHLVDLADDLRRIPSDIAQTISALEAELAKPESHIVKWSIPVDPNNFGEPLAQPEQEPVAWIGDANYVEGQFVEGKVRRVWWECNTGVGQPLYTAPPRKPWVGLTDEELDEIQYSTQVEYTTYDEGKYGMEIEIRPENFARAIEAKLKEKNT